MARQHDIDMPPGIARLPRDARGYPVPVIVLIDKTGTPQFTINDVTKVAACLAEHRCSICGRRFDRHPVTQRHEMWFVGGSLIAIARFRFARPPSCLHRLLTHSTTPTGTA